MSENFENLLMKFFNEKIPAVPEIRKELEEDRVVQFQIAGLGSFVMETTSGKVSFTKGNAQRPDFNIAVDVETLDKILKKRLGLTEAWTDGKLKPTGLKVGHFSNPPVFPWLIRILRYGLGRKLPPKE